jgi:prepilin-type processing-associated H-X9-DG protein
LDKVANNSIILIEKCYYNIATVGSFTYAYTYQYNMPIYTNTLDWRWTAEYRHSLQSNFLFKDGHVNNFKMGKIFTSQWIP